MKGLHGLVSDIDTIRSSAKIRFKNYSDFKTPEALILWEQRMLPEDEIFKLCADEYGTGRLTIPSKQYMHKDVIEFYRDSNYVPISHSIADKTIKLATIPEFEKSAIPKYQNCTVSVVVVPIYYYVEQHVNLYGNPDFLYQLPALDLFEFILEEAVTRKAIDITLTTSGEKSYVYYDINKQKEYSKRSLSASDIKAVIQFLSTKAKRPELHQSRKPKYFSVNLDSHYRGRCALNMTHDGISLTIRLLPNRPLDKSLEDLNLGKKAVKFIREIVMDEKPGLRVIGGETLSGKNTTILATFRELLKDDTRKAVSVEQPVEIYLDNLIQIDTDTAEEFEANVASLTRQNPGLVYISEMTEYTAKPTIELANTGKIAYSTVHINGVAWVINRLRALSGLDSDEIIINIHSVVYQKLIRDEEYGLKPINVCVAFTDELKANLLGKSIGEMHMILMKEEEQWTQS